MGILKNGIFGPVVGPVGNVDFYVAKGQFIMRSRRKKSTVPPSQRQLVVREKVKTVSRFLKPVTEFVKIGFADAVSGTTRSAYNAATSALLLDAITGDYPAYELDYARVLLSSGTLLQAIGPMVSVTDTRLIFEWQPEQAWPNANDRVMMLAYCAELNEAVYNLCGQKRLTGQDLLKPDLHWKGKEVHTYISFISENKNTISTSIYIGSLVF